MKKNIRKILICIYFILLSCVFLSTAFSRYSTTISGTVEMDVANIKLNIVKNTSSVTNLSNTQQSISFIVNNYDGTKESPIYNETEYQYQISITTNTNVPLQYELYKIENGTQTKLTLTNGISTSFTMAQSIIQEDEFILKVNLNDKTYKNISDVISINVYAVQSQG